MSPSGIKSFTATVLAAMPAKLRGSIARVGRACMTKREKFIAGFPALEGLLELVKENGFTPATILDVGANVGNWSRAVAPIFPAARIMMFDGNPDNAAALDHALAEIGERITYIIKLLGAEKKESITFYKLGTGSSVLPELTSHAREAVTLPMDTLDNLMEIAGPQLPILLKLDVQGFELEVLSGAKLTLSRCEMVIMETSLVPYNEGAPLLAEVVVFMNDMNFVVFDFCGQARRKTDHALFQTDIVFVRRDSGLRGPREF